MDLIIGRELQWLLNNHRNSAILYHKFYGQYV